MNKLQQFRLELEKLVPPDSKLRPFACEGSPLECRVFIVGINPAKKLEKNFWEFWDDSFGFHKQYLLTYLGQLPSGLGPARRKIEMIADAIGQDFVLDTNIYSTPAAKPEDLLDQHRTTEEFSFLLRKIRPRIVLAHGKEHTVEFFRNCCSKFNESYDEPAYATLDGIDFELLCSPHLWLPAVDASRIIGNLKGACERLGLRTWR